MLMLLFCVSLCIRATSAFDTVAAFLLCSYFLVLLLHFQFVSRKTHTLVVAS